MKTLWLLLFALLGALAFAQEDGHLLVADPAAEALYVYALPTLDLVSQMDGLRVGSHAGFLPLEGGRVLFVNEAAGELVLLGLGADLEVLGRAPVGVPASHIAVDPLGRYAVAGSDEPGKTLTLVDLETFEATSFGLESADPGVALGGEPLHILHRNAEGRLEAFAVQDVLAGNVAARSSVEVGAGGHGEAFSHALSRFYTATDDGIESAQVTADGLAPRAVTPYDASGREGGRAYFVRVNDGYLYTYLRVMVGAETPWQDWDNDLYALELSTDEVTRLPLVPGLVFRFALSRPYGLLFNVHPDGDFAYLLDVDPDSATFHEVVAQIALEPLGNAPRPGASPWDAESRRAAITPDGRWGFVSHGGDGLISVIDTEARRVVRTLQTPTALTGGGYLVAVQPGMSATDTVGR